MAPLEASISPEWVDEMFEMHRQCQYPTQVIVPPGVSVQAPRGKIHGTEPALVQDRARRLGPVV